LSTYGIANCHALVFAGGESYLGGWDSNPGRGMPPLRVISRPRRRPSGAAAIESGYLDGLRYQGEPSSPVV